jgi:hypothetical protein
MEVRSRLLDDLRQLTFTSNDVFRGEVHPEYFA